MKKFTKLLGIVLIIALVMSMGISAFADNVDDSYKIGTHTITITNTDQNVAHTYEAYRVFAGFLNADGQGTKLGNIVWGEGVNGSALLSALVNTTDPALQASSQIVITPAQAASGTEGEPGYTPAVPAVTIESGESLFKYCTTAADVANVISGFASTGPYNADGTANSGFESMSAGAIDAFATLVANNLATKAADFEADGTGKTYNATVTGDGYFFVKDTTSTLTSADGNDTLSKYLLAVVKDTTVVAKDTGITPKKEIDTGSAKVAADSAAIGDTVSFEVTVNVPNTKKYEDHFIFNMNDQLPTGMTFTGITSVTVGSATVSAANGISPVPYTAEGYDGTAGYYTLKIGGTEAAKTEGKFAWEAEGYDAVKEAGGQKITLVFNEFKKFVEKNNLIGETVTVKYTAVVNDDAAYTTTANENEVKFDYSNDPNHDYNGDEKQGTDPVGTTPEKKTRSYTTSFQIIKVDESGNKLANAIFELSGNALNRTVLTGVRYEKAPYTPKIDETVGATSYWLLKDGTYTTTDPNGENVNQSKYQTPITDTYVQVSYSTAEVDQKYTTLTVASDANGVIKFTGLNEGTYTLKEIAAPDGYNKINGTSTITITWNDPEATSTTEPAKSQGGFTLSATDFAEEAAWVAADQQFEVTIQNQSGTQLPSTGGIGTTIFYVVGSILVVAAGVLLITKKRMSREG